MISCFISYSHADRYFAMLLEEKLKNFAQVQIWRDDESIRGGEEWRLAIDAGIKACDCFMLVLSQAAFESKYVTYEMGYAFGLSKSVLPLLLEKCEMHPKVEPLQHLDFSKPSGETWKKLQQRLEDIAGSAEPPEAAPTETIEIEKANETEELTAGEKQIRDGILAYLDARGFRAMSFERVRQQVDQDADDQTLREIVRKVDGFARARLKGGKDGLRLL